MVPPEPPWASYSSLYPGDDYIDWLGLSTYGLANLPDGSYMSFEQALQTFHDPGYAGTYADITSLGSKPLALVEVGITEVPQKPQWIRDMLPTLQSSRYPRLGAISWWNSFDVNTRIESSPAAQQAFHDISQNALLGAQPRISGNCRPDAPIVRVHPTRLTWTALPNATSYEVWQRGKRIATTTLTTFRGA